MSPIYKNDLGSINMKKEFDDDIGITPRDRENS